MGDVEGSFGLRSYWRMDLFADYEVVYLQSQFSLHSGYLLGIPGRMLIALSGLVVAMLSVTGVYVWWRKRGARRGKQVSR